MTPFFTLILPVYNVAPWLERCLQSILCQSDTGYEVILVDDGSTDASPGICDEYAERYPFIRVLHKENGGLASARNAGLEAARGDYIWFVDSDDWIAPDALKLLRQACGDGPELVKFRYERVEGEKKTVCGVVPPGCYQGESLEALRRQAFCEAGKFSLSVWSHVYQRAFQQGHGLSFVSERIVGSEDYLFNLQALLQARHMNVLAQPLYSYELRAGSLTQTYKPDLAKRYTELYRRLRKYYEAGQAWPQYGALIDRFYVWHLIAGTCFHHEYRAALAGQGMRNARQQVRAMLRLPELRRAIGHADRTGLRWQKCVQLLMMSLGREEIFYYLFVVKPGRTRNSRT